MRHFTTRLCLAAGLLLCFTLHAAWALTPDERMAIYKKVVDDPTRSAEDRKLDATRKPLELLAFTGVEPGMHVMDLSAGGGYTTELLARVVGPTGEVFAQVQSARPALKARAAALGNVVVVERGDGDPIPNSARPLDLITIVLAYHDITYESVDRDAMDALLYAALSPHGSLVVIDHSARPGTGASDGKTLHRVDEDLVKDEFEKAGFQLAAEGQFLRNPDDPRDFAFFQRKDIVTDRFALRFVKP